MRRLGLALLVVYFVVGASFLVVRDLIWRDLDRWRPQIEQALTGLTGQNVRITGLTGSFSGFSPGVSAESVTVANGQGEELFSAQQVTTALNWRSLFYLSPVLDVLASRRMRVRVDRLSDNTFEVAGRRFELPDLAAGGGRSRVSTGLQRWELPEWLMAHQGFRLEDVRVDYRDRETGETLDVQGMSVQSFERDANRSLQVDIARISNQQGSVQLRASLNRALRSPVVLGETMADSGLTRPSWHGEAWLRIVDFDAGQIARVLRYPTLLSRGMVNAQAWFSLADSVPSNARLIVQGRDIALQAQQTEALFQSADAQIDARWHDNGNVELTLSDAQATDQHGIQVTVDDSTHSLTLTPDLEPVKAQFSLQAFDADKFHSFAMGLPIPADLRNRFARLMLDGQVRHLSMRFDATRAPTSFDINAEFDGLSVGYDLPAPNNPPTTWSPQLPAARNVSGRVHITEGEGWARVSGTEAGLIFPGVFEEPSIGLETLSADLAWTVMPNRLSANAAGVQRPDVRVQIRSLEFSNDDAAGQVSGSYRTAVSGPGHIDLAGRLNRADANRVHRYLPLKMLQRVRYWMRDSFESGESSDVKFVLRGDLYDFPFRRAGSGEFLIDAAVTDARFRYAPGWPVIENMDAQVTIRRGGLLVNARAGQIFDVSLHDTSARIRDFRNSVLELAGTARGPAQQMVRYVNSSPIAERISRFTDNTRVTGSAETQINLKLPFRNLDQFELSGSTRVEKASVVLTDFLPAATQVTGELQFSENGIAIEKMRARLLGGVARLYASSPQRGTTDIRLTGRVSAPGLRQFNNNPLTRALDGQAQYDAQIRLRRGVPSITVASGLQGMAVNLPPPLYKPADSELALNVLSRPLGDTSAGWQADEIRIRVPEDNIQLRARRRRDSQGQLRITRALLSVGAGDTARLPDDGLAIDLAGAPFNADRWIAFWNAEQAPDGSKDSRLTTLADTGFFAGFDLLPTRVRLAAPSARFMGRRFSGVDVAASRRGQQWQVDVTSGEASGAVEYTGAFNPADAKLVARFSQLNIPPTEVSSFNEHASPRARVLPAMDISAGQFLLGGRALGRLQLQADNRGDSWQVSEMSLVLPSARFVASGNWTNDAGNPAGTTGLTFDLDVSDAGSLLGNFGLPATLSQGAGKITGKLSWSGTLFSPDIPSLDGAMTLAMGQGRFLKTEPGVAKLIGVLNLQALPRRLSLDFSDVFRDGFAFDALVGNAQIERGVMTTDSLLMHGVQAEVLISGQADIRTEQQDLTVKVAPHINAGIASLAYAALANPAVGLGTLFAQIILDKPLKEIFGHEFHVTGSWDEPSVTQVQRHEREVIEPGSAYSPG